MRPPLLCNFCNSEILHFAKLFSEVSYENGYASSGFFPRVSGRDIKGRVHCEGKQSIRSRGAHGMSKFLDFRVCTHATGPPFTWQAKQHLGIVSK